MARELAARLRLTGQVTCLMPLHVGGVGSSPVTDLPIAYDGAGRPYVPGTSLSGVLRQCYREVFGRETEHGGGHAYAQSRPADQGSPLDEVIWGGHQGRAAASLILVDDAPIDLPPGAVVEFRDGVGIDRVTGAAAERIKYNRAVLPRGASLPLGVTFEVVEEAGERDAAVCLATLKKAFEEDRVRLGAATTRGLGRVQLSQATLQRQVLNSPAGILAAVRGEWEPLDLEIYEGALPELSDRVTVTIAWRPRGPLLVKADRDGVAADALPLVSGVDEQLTPVLPGSSVKGVLRGQAERIVRTVRGQAVPDTADPSRFLEQVKVPLVEWLFGAAGQQHNPGSGQGPQPLQKGRGALEVEDCYATARLDPARWRAIELARNEGELCCHLKAAGLGSWQQAFHVAIDRWTGGAAESLLYTVLEPMGVEWEALRLTLNPGRLPKDLVKPALALLLLVLRDLQDGLLSLGHGGNRGLGTIEVTSLTLRGRVGSLPVQASDDLDGLLATLRESWRAWIEPSAAVEEPSHG